MDSEQQTTGTNRRVLRSSTQAHLPSTVGSLTRLDPNTSTYSADNDYQPTAPPTHSAHLPLHLPIISPRILTSPPQNRTGFTFQQESLRRNRLIHVPSTMELPDSNQDPTQSQENTPQSPTRAHTNNRDDIATNNIDRQAEDEAQQEDERDRSISRAAKMNVIGQLIFNFCIILGYGLGYLWLKDEINLQRILFVCLAFVTFGAIITVKRGLSSPNGGFQGIENVVNLIGLGLYLISGILKAGGSQQCITLFSLIGIILFLSFTCATTNAFSEGPSEMLVLLIKTVTWVELLLIGLRVDGLMMPWSTIFIPLYFTLVILTLSSVIVIFGSLFVFCSIMREEGVSWKLIIGSFWYFINSLYTPIWLGVTTESAKQLDNGKSNIEAMLKAGMIHSGLLLAFTLVFWSLLCKFQEFEVQSGMLGHEEQEEIEENDLERGGQMMQVRFQVVKDEHPSLVMISPSFFAYFKKSKKGKNNKQVEELKKKVERAKLEKQQKGGLALEMHFMSDKVVNEKTALSPTMRKNLDFSEGDIVARMDCGVGQTAPTLRRGESTRSNENSCMICFDSPPNGVMMDCGHGGLCYDCALECWKKSDNCILCRERINRVLKIITVKPLNMVRVLESTKKIVE